MQWILMPPHILYVYVFIYVLMPNAASFKKEELPSTIS